MRLEFVTPDPSMERQALAFRDAFYAAGEKVINGSGGLDIYPDYREWLGNIADVEAGRKDGLVPKARIRFARDADTGDIVGIIDIRPALPGDKLQYGHLGYATLPGRRGKGVATQMVRWGIDTLRAEGVCDILASVYESNSPSIRVLEKCGFLQKGFWRDEEGRVIVQYVNVADNSQYDTQR